MREQVVERLAFPFAFFGALRLRDRWHAYSDTNLLRRFRGLIRSILFTGLNDSLEVRLVDGLC